MSGDNKKPGFFRRRWNDWYLHPFRSTLLTLFLVGAFGGIIVGDGFGLLLEMTNTQEFCTSCHSMKGNLEEYKKTIHYTNRSGVRATCPDCHVPHKFIPKILRKFEARKDVWGEIVGHIDTPEKFEERRMEMATREWQRMKDSDSMTCRGCHNFDAMSKDKQGQTRFGKHMKAKEEGGTCIDCHKGIAHKLPKGYKDPNEEEDE